MLVQTCVETNNASTQVYGDEPPKPLKNTTHTGSSTQTNTTISTAHAIAQTAPTTPYTSTHMPATSEMAPHMSSPTPTLYTMGAVPKAMKHEPSMHYKHSCTSATSPDAPSTSHLIPQPPASHHEPPMSTTTFYASHTTNHSIQANPINCHVMGNGSHAPCLNSCKMTNSGHCHVTMARVNTHHHRVTETVA